MGQEVDWAMANADITSFIHKKRCASGVDGTMVTSPGGVTYKTWRTEFVEDGGHRDVPATCRSSARRCDQNPACTSYAVDSAQQNCLHRRPVGGGSNYTMYFRLPGL